MISLTRVFSKSSAGVAALCGGLLAWRTGTYAGLFWLSTGFSLLGAFLLLSYPSSLEGEWTRERDRDEGPAEPWWPRFRRLLAHPGVAGLLLASLLFETQTKLGLAYLQPYLADEAERWGLTVLGGLGAVALGGYVFCQGLAGGASSALSAPWEERWGARSRALRWAHRVGWAGLLLCALALLAGVAWLGLAGLLLLACLQNLRRPIFVATLNERMDPYQRATTLSLESQARALLYALLALASGWLAELGGLEAVFAALALLGVATLGLPRDPREPARESPAAQPETAAA